MLQLLLVVLFLFSGISRSFEITKYCDQCPEEDIKLFPLPELTLPYSRLLFLNLKVKSLHDSQSILRNDLMVIGRALRDGKSADDFERAQEEISEIQRDFDRLTKIQKESLKLEKQFTICAINCSAARRVELEKNLASIGKLKTSLLLKRPILAHKRFEKRLSELSDKEISSDLPIPSDVFRGDLLEAIFDTAQIIDNKVRSYSSFLNDRYRPLIKTGNESYISTYLEGVTDKFPEVIEDVLEVSLNSKGPDKISSCYFAKQFSSHSEMERRQRLAVDAGLLIIPLLAGPAGLETAFAARLAIWGVRAESIRKLHSGTVLALEAGLALKDRQQLHAIENKCRRKEVELLSNSTKEILQELKKCREDYGEELFLANALIVPGALSSLKLISEIPRRLPVLTKTAASSKDVTLQLQQKGFSELKGHQLALEFPTPNDGVFTVINLQGLKGKSTQELEKISEEYWRYVGGIYRERLNLTDAEINSFVASSVEMGPRTTLIINTEKSAFKEELKFKGGVGIVTSRSVHDLLPLEKATGLRVPKDGKVAEIVRLTAGKDANAADLSSALIDQVVALVEKDRDLSKLYIFTSKVHARLYKSIGVPMDKKIPAGDRDVIIEMDKSGIEKLIKSRIKS